MAEQPPEPLLRNAGEASTVADLASLLRDLRRRHARQRHESPLTYRELAARTGWSHSAIAEYFGGTMLAPTDRFDALVKLLGATPAEQGLLAVARDRVEEHQRQPPATGRVDTATSPVPRHLPPDVYAFAGRSTQLADLDALVATEERTSAVVISAISGTAGIGKTALAVRWAHRVSGRFPDGQLYVDLRGFDPSGSPRSPATAVREFLDAFGVPAHRVPVDVDGQAALYRSMLAGKRVLIVLDNARDAEQVRPLLPGEPGCLVLITSRNQLTSLVAVEGAHPLVVDLLTAAEAWQLLAGRLGVDRVAAEPEAVADIVAMTARLPLALAVVAARAAAHPDFPLARFADQLRGSRDRLDALDAGDRTTDIRAVFAWSYQTLRPQTARMFRLIGLQPGPDLAAPAAASLAGLPLEKVRPLLAELAGAHLIDEHAPGRYRVHDLLRAYATELASTDDAEPRRAAAHRMLDHYLHTAYAADRLLDANRHPIALAEAQPGVVLARLTEPAQAMAWFTAEQPALLAVVDHAAATGFDTHAWQLSWALWTFLFRRGRWHDWAVTGRTAVAAAQRLADPLAQATALRLLAQTYVRLGRVDEAHALLRCAIDVSGRAGDPTTQAFIHYSLGQVLERWGRYREALDHERQALDLFRAAGHRLGQANALNTVGWFSALLGDHAQALVACRQALTLFKVLGDRAGQAATWDSLGLVHHHLAQYDQAVACYRRAVDLNRDVGTRHTEAATLARLGDTHHAAGHPKAARDAWEHALAMLDELGHPDAGDVRAKLEGPPYG